MSKYILIPNIKVINANAQPTWWIISAPSMTAYVGFAHALALSMNAKRHEGVAIIHHDIQFLGEEINNQYGLNFLPHQFRASGFIDRDDYAKNSVSLSSQPTARCHLNISLVIALPEETKISSLSVEKFLRGARIAGGSIIKHDDVQCLATTHQEALKAINKNGYSIIERQDLMMKREEDRDMIDVLLRNTRRYKNDFNKQIKKSDKEETKSAGWIVPTCLGYAGISSVKEKNKVRNGLTHLYVEPLVGLVQYKNSRNAGLHFWRYKNYHPNIFVISTNK
jgi:CRISPR-associated protein Csy2